MQIPKPSDDDRAFFAATMPDHPDVTVKPMFGNVGAFVNGNMFAGLFGGSIGVRLSDADRAELEAMGGAGPFGPAERPMVAYVSLPAGWRETPERVTDWMERARSHVSAMPPKKPKK